MSIEGEGDEYAISVQRVSYHQVSGTLYAKVIQLHVCS